MDKSLRLSKPATLNVVLLASCFLLPFNALFVASAEAQNRQEQEREVRNNQLPNFETITPGPFRMEIGFEEHIEDGNRPFISGTVRKGDNWIIINLDDPESDIAGIVGPAELTAAISASYDFEANELPIMIENYQTRRADGNLSRNSMRQTASLERIFTHEEYGIADTSQVPIIILNMTGTYIPNPNAENDETPRSFLGSLIAQIEKSPNLLVDDGHLEFNATTDNPIVPALFTYGPDGQRVHAFAWGVASASNPDVDQGTIYSTLNAGLRDVIRNSNAQIDAALAQDDGPDE